MEPVEEATPVETLITSVILKGHPHLLIQRMERPLSLGMCTSSTYHSYQISVLLITKDEERENFEVFQSLILTV